MLDMLEPGWSDIRRGQVLLRTSNNEGCHFTDPWPSAEKRTTVKNLLTMKRQRFQRLMSHQKNYMSGAPSPQQMGNVSSMDPSSTPLSQLNPTQVNLSPAPVHFNPVNTVYPHYLPPCAVPSNEILLPSQTQQPAPEGPLTLFHWQIQQQLAKLNGVSTDLLIEQDSDGDTPLHIAVAQGKRALVYALAAHMAVSDTLDIKEHNGQTALHIAVATNQYLIVCDLLQHGAQVNTRDVWGRSPLHVCVEKGHYWSLKSIFKTLSESSQCYDIDMANYDGLTPLHTAVLSHNAVIRELARLEKFSDTEALVKKGHKYFECIKILLKMGASCGTKDQKSGRSSLHMAAEEANAHLIKLFLNHPSWSFFLNLRTFSGNTALHIVCSLEDVKGQVEAVKMLMSRGGDPGLRNYENELPCQLVPVGPTGEKVRQILKGKDVHV